MDQKELEKKLEELTRQLQKEKAEKEALETRLSEKPGVSLKKFQEAGRWIQTWVMKIRQSFEPAPKARVQTDTTTAAAVAAPAAAEHKTALQESLRDDIATYRRKLAGYTLHQLEDIFLHIEREAHPERFAALVEELRKRPLP